MATGNECREKQDKSRYGEVNDTDEKVEKYNSPVENDGPIPVVDVGAPCPIYLNTLEADQHAGWRPWVTANSRPSAIHYSRATKVLFQVNIATI